jgi:hypothetical protein
MLRMLQISPLARRWGKKAAYEQRNWTEGRNTTPLNGKTTPEGCSAFPPIAATKSGQLMCYKNRTTPKATDRPRSNTTANASVAGSARCPAASLALCATGVALPPIIRTTAAD